MLAWFFLSKSFSGKLVFGISMFINCAYRIDYNSFCLYTFNEKNMLEFSTGWILLHKAMGVAVGGDIQALDYT